MDDGSLDCASKILAAILCVFFGGHVLGFFVWAVAIGQPQVLLLLPLVALLVGFLLVVVRVYWNKSHPIHNTP